MRCSSSTPVKSTRRQQRHDSRLRATADAARRQRVTLRYALPSTRCQPVCPWSVYQCISVLPNTLRQVWPASPTSACSSRSYSTDARVSVGYHTTAALYACHGSLDCCPCGCGGAGPAAGGIRPCHGDGAATPGDATGACRDQRNAGESQAHATGSCHWHEPVRTGLGVLFPKDALDISFLHMRWPLQLRAFRLSALAFLLYGRLTIREMHCRCQHFLTIFSSLVRFFIGQNRTRRS